MQLLCKHTKLIEWHILKILKQLDNEEIIDCFSLSFSDYSISFKLSLKQFELVLI